MKHLNFLSKSGSQSGSHRVVTLASTVGSPSAHRRSTMLRLLSVLVLVLTFGVGQMWGGQITITADDITDYPSGQTAYGTRSWTDGTISGNAKVYGSTTNHPALQFNSSNRTLWNTTALPGRITSIVMTTYSGTGTARAWRVFGGATAATSSSGTSYGAEIGSSQTVSTSGTTYTVSSGNNYTYFMCYLNASNAAYISSIVVNYEDSQCTNPSTLLSITSSNTATMGTDLTLETSGGNGSSVTWTVANGTGSATVSGNTLTPTGVGTVTVTATQDDYNKKCGKVVNQTITISKATANITLYDANGSSTPSGTFYGGDPYTPPTTAANCSGKVLVGWSTVEILEEGAKPSSNYADKGTAFTLSAGTNAFYAVYATQGGSAPSASSLEFTYASHSGWTIGGTNEDKSTYYLLKAASGSKGYIESPTISDLSTITSIVVHAGFFGGADYGTFKVYGGSTQYGDTESPANKNDNEFTFNPSPNPLSGSGKIKIINAGSNSDANGTRLFSATINYSVGGYTYSNYVTSCCSSLGSINGSFFWTTPF